MWIVDMSWVLQLRQDLQAAHQRLEAANLKADNEAAKALQSTGDLDKLQRGVALRDAALKTLRQEVRSDTTRHIRMGWVTATTVRECPML